jgi:acid phosphatase
MLELYHKLQNANFTFQGDLAFLNTWDFFAIHPTQQFEQLTSTGSHAGILGAFSAGVKLRTRYLSLLEKAEAQKQTTLWASDSRRVIDSARYFAEGFFGLNHTATIQIIPETLSRGGDTLTPSRACSNYFNDVDGQGRGYGARQLLAWQETYIPAIRKRLQLQNPQISFTTPEVYTMQVWQTQAVIVDPADGVLT